MVEKSVSLIERKSDDISIYLSAKIDSDGDLVLEGQDLGPGVESHWGDSDYEYWTIVGKDRKLEVLLLLINDAFPNIQEVYSWLKSTGVSFSEDGRIELDNEFSIDADADSITFYQQAGEEEKEAIVTIDGANGDKILLLLLQYIFQKELFLNDSEFMDWLKKKGVEYKFHSYV